MASSPAPDSLGASLLAWVRSFDDIGTVIDHLGELSDGRALWAILQDVDGDYFSGSLPEPDIGPSTEWTRKWQNLKHLHKQLSMYYRDVCSGAAPAVADPGPDLKAIAAEASMPDLQRLIMDIIRAAMSSEETNKRMGQRLMSLGQGNAMAIAFEIRRMQEAEFVDSEPASRDESAYQSEQEVVDRPRPGGSKKESGGMFGDPMLEREEELLQAQATIEKLQASQAAAQRQLQALRVDKEHLQEQFDLYRSEIDGKGRRAPADDAYKKLHRQAESDRAYIDNLEAQLQSSRDSCEKYERQLQRVKEEGESSQKLRDDLQLLRAENEDLNQKAKATENLKKKIQTLQEQEKTNVSLRADLRSANERIEDLERLKQVQAVLEKEIIEKKGLIRNQEYQINELTTTRKHAEYDARVLAQKLEAARERQDQDHEALEELRMKLQEHGGAKDDLALEPPTSSDDKEVADDDDAPKPLAASQTDEQKHFLDKLALLEQQLEAADARLKQASQRYDALEEDKRTHEAALAADRAHAQQQALDHEATIAQLRRELETATIQPQIAAAPTTTAPPPPPPPDMVALQRENQLMVSAWYDLSSRLQYNGVSLGRRRHEPRSWIGKQRALVGPNNHSVAGR